MKSKLKFIDLFCGIGGFHQALTSLGAECVFASDIDKQCRATYNINYNLMPHGDITKVSAKDIPPHNIICAGFPCQSFSKAGNRKGISDPRGTLFFDIMRIATFHNPEYMILENVRNLAKHDNGNTWKTIHHHVSKNYYVNPEPLIFSPHNIGIPQFRERVFILCKRKDLGPLPSFNFLKGKNSCNINSIILDNNQIHNLSDYFIKEKDIDIINIWNEFIQNIHGRLPGFPIWADRLCELNPNENLDLLPSWQRNFVLKNNSLFLENKEFISKWLVRASSIPSFKGSKAKFEWQAGQSKKPNIWENIMHFRPSGLRVKKPNYFPALVAITHTSIIGKRKRYLTPREGARLQSFPDSFILNPNDKVAYKQLGNSVNVSLVKKFAEFLIFKK